MVSIAMADSINGDGSDTLGSMMVAAMIAAAMAMVAVPWQQCQ